MTAPAPRLHANGLRQPKRAPSLKFSAIRRPRVALTGLPTIPDYVDYLAHLNDWQLFANDRAGTCAAITWANTRRLLTAGLTGAESYPTIDQVVALYQTQNPDFDLAGDPAVNGPGSPADGGMDMQTLLEHLHSEGGPDGVKVIAFAEVDTSNPEELSAAIAIFGGIWLGVLVQDAQQEDFVAGQEWTWVTGSPVEGGHAVLAGGYDRDCKRIITWGAEATVSDSYLDPAALVAFVPVFPEHLGSVPFLQGVDLSALAAAYTELTGRPLELTPPVPAPVDPTPEPDPAPVDPEPQPEPQPEPIPDPEPEPTPEPEPAPVDPAPVDPDPEPTPEPEPVDPPVDPAPVEPTPEPAPEPDPEPAPEPTPDPEPAPAPDNGAVDYEAVVSSFPWEAADAFIRGRDGLPGHLITEKFRGQLIRWLTDLPIG